MDRKDLEAAGKELEAQTGAPPQYIRTFEGDIDVFKRGGMPGLAPKEPGHTATPSERLIEASPVATAETVPTPVTPLPETAIPVTPSAEIEPVVPSEPEPSLPPLKTYSHDFRDRLTQTGASTATVLAAEQDAQPVVQTVAEPITPDPHARWYLMGAIALLILSILGIGIGYIQYARMTAPVPVVQSRVTPIFVDSTVSVTGSGAALTQAVVQAVKKEIPFNSVAELAFAHSSSTNLFLALPLQAPGIVVRNVRDSGNMAGIVNRDGKQSLFFIVSVDLYSATFSGMLDWERTMLEDMRAIYPRYPVSTTASTTATTTKSTTSRGGFRDEQVSNHDVRVYRDSEGRSVIAYGYWNQRTLVIGRDSFALSEIFDRLATSRPQ